MTALSYLFIFFSVISLGMSTTYFYIFARSQENFVRLWGICWALYSCSLLFLFIGNITEHMVFFPLRKILDLYNILFLLYATYSFIKKRPPGYWIRFALYITIWIFVSIVYNFDIMSIYMPISIYQMVLTFTLCTIIYRHWNVPGFEKTISIIAFFIWGIGKAAISLVEALNINVDNLYLLEMLFLNIVNYVIFIIYLQNSQERLDRTLKRFEIITENFSDVLFFYTLEPNPEISYITPSVQKMIGITPAKVYANEKFYIDYIYPEDYDVFKEVMDFTSGETEKKAVIRLYNSDARIMWVEFSTKMIFDGCSPVAIEGIIRDVTITKEAENQLVSSKKSRDILLSYISHELKTPITSILGYVAALKDGTLADQKSKEMAINVIYNKTITLEKLVVDLVQLSKLETKQLSFNFSLFECTELALEIIKRHVHDGEEKRIELKTNVEKARLKNKTVIADVDRLDQVFSNILNNALRYTKSGKTIAVNFSTDKKGENFIFSINNSGPLISEKDMPYIFDRFYSVNRGKAAEGENGSGLGLTISKELINAHRGSISVVSNKKVGTTFTVTLPLFNDKEL